MKKITCLLMSALMLSSVGFTACGKTSDSTSDGSADVETSTDLGSSETPGGSSDEKYEILVECQSEQGEEEVLKVLKARYEALYPDRKINLKTFSGEGFEEHMMGFAEDESNAPHVIWTSDTLHSGWDDYFTDLRPFYEASAETDYSLYYETMLDTAATNGKFKPTKNYKGTFRSDDLDWESDGLEDYENHSEYGLYYAPRDYNKPAILCNTYLFAELDAEYEKQYKATEGVAEMPAEYKSTTARLNEIVNEVDWDELNDLYAFAQFIASRIAYVVENPSSTKQGKWWALRSALDLFLDWEPTYTTIMHELNMDILEDDGDLNLEEYKEQFESIHNGLFPEEGDIADYVSPTSDSNTFGTGYVFMTVCSRPAVLGYSNTFEAAYGSSHLETISLPVEYIAAGASGYAIMNYWDGEGQTKNGVYKSYAELSWDFIKFIITEEGQEVAGATGLNIPILKSLHDKTSSGAMPAWKTVEKLGNMDHDAWLAGEELKQDMFNIFIPYKRNTFRDHVKLFFIGLQRKNYNAGDLDELITAISRNYKYDEPQNYLLEN